MKRVAGLVLSGVLGAVGAGCSTPDANWQERYLETEQERATAIEELSAERAARTAATAEAEAARMAALQGGRSDAPVMPPRGGKAVDDAVKDLRARDMDAAVTADGNITITLPSDINFGAGSKELTSAGKKVVEQVAKELDSRFPGYSVRIEGHTDADPIKKSNFKDNWELGSERALAVLRYLTTLGVSSERLTSSSRGDTMPVGDNKSNSGKAKNRRVEVIVLVPQDAAMAE